MVAMLWKTCCHAMGTDLRPVDIPNIPSHCGASTMSWQLILNIFNYINKIKIPQGIQMLHPNYYVVIRENFIKDTKFQKSLILTLCFFSFKTLHFFFSILTPKKWYLQKVSHHHAILVTHRERLTYHNATSAGNLADRSNGQYLNKFDNVVLKEIFENIVS